MDSLITHNVTTLDTQDRDRTKSLIIQHETIDTLIVAKNKKVTEQVEKLEKWLNSIDQTLWRIFNRVNEEATVTFTEIKVVIKIIHDIYDKAIQLKSKQAMDHTNVLSLIKEL